MRRFISSFLLALLLSVAAHAAEPESAPAEPPTAETAPATAPAPEPAIIEEGRDFRRVVPAQPTRVAPGKVEVIEFFWYGCPHCYASEKHIEAWLADKPEEVVFVRVPATLSRGWALMAQAYYTAEALGVLHVMHPALFAAFHEQPVMLGSPERLAAYFEEKAGVDTEAFREAFNSIEVASKVHRADQLARQYRVAGVPSMTVNGKYITDPEQAGGYEAMLRTVDTLARFELQSQEQ